MRILLDLAGDTWLGVLTRASYITAGIVTCIVSRYQLAGELFSRQLLSIGRRRVNRPSFVTEFLTFDREIRR